MSSHREAPEISKDPAADNTDVYAFVDPTDSTKVNLIANFNPFEIPYGGPNFSEFADDVLYTINIANPGNAQADISYQFRFKTTIRNTRTFLYNTGPIANITSTALEPTADLLGHQGRPCGERVAHLDRARDQPARPAVQRRRAQHAELRGDLRGRRGAGARHRTEGVRRAAVRSVLRRPRQRVRPRRAAAPEPRPPDPAARDAGDERSAGPQRATPSRSRCRRRS